MQMIVYGDGRVALDPMPLQPPSGAGGGVGRREAPLDGGGGTAAVPRPNDAKNSVLLVPGPRPVPPESTARGKAHFLG